ncbi:MAG: hypothetical protein K6E83_08545 [Clostridium sp.]|nr:hypothetical protein [Clostridium sp.]
MGRTLKEGGRDLEVKVLNVLKERIAVHGDRAEIVQAEWNGRPLDILAAELTHFGERMDRCLGEYSFEPVPGDPDGAKYFRAVITLRDEIALERVPGLAFALSFLNFYLETGCFALNKPSDLLIFKNTRTFPGDTPEEILVKDAVLLMEEAYETAARYAAPVLSLAEGSMETAEFLELIRT